MHHSLDVLNTRAHATLSAQRRRRAATCAADAGDSIREGTTQAHVVSQLQCGELFVSLRGSGSEEEEESGVLGMSQVGERIGGWE